MQTLFMRPTGSLTAHAPEARDADGGCNCRMESQKPSCSRVWLLLPSRLLLLAVTLETALTVRFRVAPRARWEQYFDPICFLPVPSSVLWRIFPRFLDDSVWPQPSPN